MAAPPPGAPGVHEPAAVPGAPGMSPGPDSLLQVLQSLWRELPGLVSDRVELLGLELRRAGHALQQIMLLLVATAVLAVTAWLVLWGGIVAALVAFGLHLAWALLILLTVNLLVIGLLLARMRALLPHLKLPATQRHLTLSPEPGPRVAEPELHHERHDLAPGQPAAH